MTIFQERRANLKRYRKGHEATLRAIYAFYVKDVERFVSTGWYNPKTNARTLGIQNFETCAELIQEVFVKAFSEKARASYDGIRPFRAFLYTIARNVVIDYMRKAPKDAIGHRWVEMDEVRMEVQSALQDEFQSEDNPPEEILHWRRCLEETKQFVATLDEVSQSVVRLRMEEEIPQLEAARQLNLSRGKIRAIEKRLHRELRTHLETLNLV